MERDEGNNERGRKTLLSAPVPRSLSATAIYWLLVATIGRDNYTAVRVRSNFNNAKSEVIRTRRMTAGKYASRLVEGVNGPTEETRQRISRTSDYLSEGFVRDKHFSLIHQCIIS